jgi:hypothetical protein
VAARVLGHGTKVGGGLVLRGGKRPARGRRKWIERGWGLVGRLGEHGLLLYKLLKKSNSFYWREETQRCSMSSRRSSQSPRSCPH